MHRICFDIFLIILSFLTINVICTKEYQKWSFIKNCPKEFTYNILKNYIEEGSIIEAQKVINSLGLNEQSILYGLTEIYVDTDAITLKIILPDIEKIDSKISKKFAHFLSFGYVFDCKNIKLSTKFLFWLIRHLDIQFLPAGAVLSIIKHVFKKAGNKYGYEYFIPSKNTRIINLSEIILQNKNDNYPSIFQINHAIKLFTSTSKFIDNNGPLELPNLEDLETKSIEDKRLRARVYLLQKAEYLPDIKEKSQMKSVRYIIRTSRYYLNRYITPEMTYKLWSVVYNAITGLILSEYRNEMSFFILKKNYFDTWPHEADVLDAISTVLKQYKIKTKDLSIHSKWYNNLKKEGYMLSFPKNTKTSRWFCRFFQHHLHIFINPYLQFDIWKSILVNLLEPFTGQISVSNDKCFFKEDPKFPWPTCHKTLKSDPNYISIEHDKVLDNLSYEFARIIHSFNPGYPFHDICEVTKLLISSGSYRREVRQPKSSIKHSISIRKLERINYLKNIVRNYRISKKYEPFLEPNNEVMFFFRYYIENGIEIDNKIIKKIAEEKFMDEDLDDIVKTRNFVSDCAKVYSSIPSREQWNDDEIQEIPARGRKAISVACSNLFYSKPKCAFEFIPAIHPARESGNILSGEFSLRVFSFFRSIGILNITPEEFCEDSIHVLSRIFNIETSNFQNTRRESLKRARFYERERFLRNKLVRFKTLNINENNKSTIKKMNDMMEQILKSKIQERLKPKWYNRLITTSSRPLDLSKREDNSEWELDELQDIIRLGKKFVFYTSFKQFPPKKFRKICNKVLKNLILKIEGNHIYFERKKQSNKDKKLTNDKISHYLTKNLCFSLGNWQQSINKRVKNFIEFLWLKMNNQKNNYKFIDTSSIPIKECLSESCKMNNHFESNINTFYSNLSLNLKQMFPQFDIKLPNTNPLEFEVLKLKKLGYECPPPRLYKNNALPAAEECIKYLYRYGLYVLNGIVFDLELLYKIYLKSFRDSGFTVIAFMPSIFTPNLTKSLVKTNIFDYNFHRYETLCSLNEISNIVHWKELFIMVESISKDMITALHTSNVILPGTSNPLLIPRRTSIHYICEFILNLLNPNNFANLNTQVNDFFRNQILNDEYKDGLAWNGIKKINLSYLLNSDNNSKKLSRYFYTSYFIQSCIRSIMKQFPGFHYIFAALLCRKTKEWRSCDEPTHARENYLSDIKIGDFIEKNVLKRLLKGTFVDMITFDLQENFVSYFWGEKMFKISDNKLPVSYIKFCPISVRIHDYLQTKKFKTFLDACTFSLETDHLFKQEINGEMYTIKKSLANKICSNTYWGKQCNHPTIRESALFFYEQSMEIMQASTHTIPLSIFCNLAYEMAFNIDPINFCFKPHTFEDTRQKVGSSPYTQTDNKNTQTENYRTREWDIKQINYENPISPLEDPNGMLGHIIKMNNYNHVYLGDLRKICEKALVSIRDCSKIPSFSKDYPNIVKNPELIKKVNEEALKLFSPLIKKKNPKLFEDIPIRIATFVEICKLAVSTFDISYELFNTACVASFGWDKFLNSNEEITKYTDWSSSILFCSSTPKWKSCKEWSNIHQTNFKNMESFQLADSYLNATPLQKAVVDFMSIFFTTNISLFLSGIHLKSISEDPKDQKYISYLRKKNDLFCPASIELLLNYDIKIDSINEFILFAIRSKEISYSKIRNIEPNLGIPYLFFNIDCPQILSKHILNFIETIKKQDEDLKQTNTFGFNYNIPNQWERKEYILEFSVRVCKKHFSWKNCSIKKEVLENYTPIEINIFEYVASYMYFEYIKAELKSKNNIFNEENEVRPLQKEFDIFCRISINVITQHPRMMKKEEIKFIIENTLPTNMKEYVEKITDSLLESYRTYIKGTEYLNNLKSTNESNKFSFA